ncbi:hypothetical protein SLV14_006588 [Streptomyces sp. Je 1-4]|nr:MULTISPECIES: hypothetical protein [unclassified Streptomyces]UYB43593.1 hypothetical protein SLV14_006588 [Streptomyces sp. Je 1-4]UZQ39984.1 hypothetical protein SLV14N_006588 [Streptomyces sp. Je 1-4] [Streptomyces sp. Je 1-4 4N24]UZQ47401.1 hypothetical protein SLV14NA_006588 [Streptomyces sp. Je 1-4] [Streptomyces sp. Je 1-4 4N24_ara]
MLTTHHAGTSKPAPRLVDAMVVGRHNGIFEALRLLASLMEVSQQRLSAEHADTNSARRWPLRDDHLGLTVGE